MKAIMISDKPKWCAKIMNGEKTIEVRRNKALATAIQKLIDENGYADIYVYCTEDSKYCLVRNNIKKTYHLDTRYWDEYESNLNGKVVFKFRCDKVEKIGKVFTEIYYTYRTKSLEYNELFGKSCLGLFELEEYLKEKIGYAIHISQLEIFGKPKELWEFRKPSTLSLKQLQEFGLSYDEKTYKEMATKGKWFITKAPQNFCYIKSEE